MRLIAPTMGLWIIGMIILVGSLLVSFNAEAEEEVVLECAGAEVVKNKQKVFTYVFIKGEKITYRTEWESGYREEIYTVGYILNSPDGIQEFIWSYNRNTNSVSALNEPAQKILDILK